MSQWDQIKSIVDEALEKESVPERCAYVEDVCAGDAALREEVNSLLVAYEKSSSFFDAWEEGTRASVDGSTPGAHTPTRFGPYRVEERLGRGGMGTVYRAERDDEQFQRQVALKVLHHGHERDDFARRFRTERQILASLSHPYIARLYDGGLAEDGLPYFAMELVSGRPIMSYCAEEHLGITERLRLFEQVAEAVKYAHRKLVVHRDLKPSNILVDENNTPKLLDFGIAKLVDKEVPYTQPITKTGQLLMTPEYAAPEQVIGEAITTGTDVYQLGVLLYELLTGRRPHELEEKSPSAIERVIVEEEPKKPSKVLGEQAPWTSDESQETSEVLAGDLDTIVMKALRKEPVRRYSSVEALLEDIKRYREGRPITARPATWRYRARKFVRRNGWSVGTGVAFAVLLIVYALTVTVQARRVAAERDRAQAAKTEAQISARKSKQMSNFLIDLFEKADPRQAGGELTARDLLDQATTQLDSDFADYPDVKSGLLEVIGDAYRNQGYYQQAYNLHLLALKLRKKQSHSSRGLAAAENNVGEALYYLGRYEKAGEYFRTSLQMRRRVLDSNHVDIAQSLNNLALLDIENAHYNRAKHRYKEALSIFQAKLGKKSWRTVNALSNLASAEYQEGRYEDAQRHFRRALSARKSISKGPDRDVAIILDHIGDVLRHLGYPQQAEETHRQALTMFRQVTSPDTPFAGYALLGIACDKRAQGDYETANRFYQKALAHYRQALREGHERITNPLLEWGKMYLMWNRPQDAEPLLREALRIRRKAFPKGHWKTSEVRCALAKALTSHGHYTEADTVLAGDYDALRRRRGRRSKYVQAIFEKKIALYEAWGKPDRAKAYRDSLRKARIVSSS